MSIPSSRMRYIGKSLPGDICIFNKFCTVLVVYRLEGWGVGGETDRLSNRRHLPIVFRGPWKFGYFATNVVGRGRHLVVYSLHIFRQSAMSLDTTSDVLEYRFH